MLTTIALALIQALGAYGSEIADSYSPSSANRQTSVECSRIYTENNCPEFFKQHPELGPQAVDCAHPPTPIKGLSSCFGGAARSIEDYWDLFVTLTRSNEERTKLLLIYDECAKTEECKLNLMRSIDAAEPSPEFAERLARVTQGKHLDVLVHLRTQRQQREHMLAARDLIRTEPDSEARDQKLDALLPGYIRTKADRAETLWSIGLAASKKVLKGTQCLRGDVQTELVCHALSSFLLPGTVIKAGTKASAILRALQGSKELRATIGAVEPAAQVASRITRAEKATHLKLLGNGSDPRSIQLIKAIDEAHAVGAGQLGRDGLPSGLRNYTDQQLRSKLRILERAGFTPTQAKALVRSGVVGEGELGPIATIVGKHGNEVLATPSININGASGLFREPLTDSKGSLQGAKGLSYADENGVTQTLFWPSSDSRGVPTQVHHRDAAASVLTDRAERILDSAERELDPIRRDKLLKTASDLDEYARELGGAASPRTSRNLDPHQIADMQGYQFSGRPDKYGTFHIENFHVDSSLTNVQTSAINNGKFRVGNDWIEAMASQIRSTHDRIPVSMRAYQTVGIKAGLYDALEAPQRLRLNELLKPIGLKLERGTDLK